MGMSCHQFPKLELIQTHRAFQRKDNASPGRRSQDDQKKVIWKPSVSENIIKEAVWGVPCKQHK